MADETNTEAAEAKSTRGTVKAVVTRDYWPEADERVTAGTIINVSKDDLIAGMETGSLAPFKGKE